MLFIAIAGINKAYGYTSLTPTAIKNITFNFVSAYISHHTYIFNYSIIFNEE